MVSRVIVPFLLFVLSIPCLAQVKKPVAQFGFSKPDYRKGQPASLVLRSAGGACTIESLADSNREAVRIQGGSCLVSTNMLKAVKGDAFALVISFRGKSFEFISYPRQDFSVTFNYPYFSFTTSSKKEGKNIRSYYRANLTGSGPYGYDHYNDGNWHTVVFNFSSRLGRREIWADGVLINPKETAIPSGHSALLEASDGFKGSIDLDEVSLYDQFLDSVTIRKLTQSLAGSNSIRSTDFKSIFALDTMQFAPGFPRYTVSLPDQLKRFPSPRYARGHKLSRNVSWMDINYLSERSAPAAVEIETEMYKRWNYWLDIPLLRESSQTANRMYGDANTVPGAILKLAQQQPGWGYSLISMQAQIQPRHAGYNSDKPYVFSQQLAAKNYLSNKQGQPILVNGKKQLSPLMDPQIMEQDAETVRFYLSQLTSRLKRAPALINENGEVFGTAYREALLQQDPVVWKDFQRSGLSRTQYFGRFQNKMEERFRSIVLKDLPASTIFSFFQVSAVQPDFWGAYEYRKKVNRMPDGSIRSTPDFYPFTPSNWQLANGPYNGYGMIAKGRAIEIPAGDTNFSPFVAAGWQEEKDNIRPAQWLALLKSMVMLGADFFYVGYFNVTGPGGKWPNGIGPYDPKGYAYQVAIPAYAQAIRTHAPHFFEQGELLNADSLFRFSASAPNDLVIVRKWKNEWLIYGSIQPNSNQAGNVPDQRITSILLEQKRISFPITRQGSLYILKGLDKGNPVFYQLDAWHQVEHPFFWSSALSIEAELLKVEEGTAEIITQAHKPLDYSRFTSFRRLLPGARLSYDFEGLEQQKIRVAELVVVEKNNVPLELEWKHGDVTGRWKGLPSGTIQLKLEGSGKFEFKVKNGELNLDKIVLKP